MDLTKDEELALLDVIEKEIKECGNQQFTFVS